MSLVIYPRLSEKSYGLSTASNTYVFNVPLTANKIELKKAIEVQYKVKVININIVRMNGKVKRTLKKSGRRTIGRLSDFKKAYVMIAKGQTIPAFAAAKDEK